MRVVLLPAGGGGRTCCGCAVFLLDFDLVRVGPNRREWEIQIKVYYHVVMDVGRAA